MKQQIYIIFLFCFFIQTITAQTTQSIVTTEPGKLSELLKTPETVRYLQVSGFMDARDFFYLRDNCPNIVNLNVKNVKISAYDTYPANTIPDFALSREAYSGTWLELSLKVNSTNIKPTESLSSLTNKWFLVDKNIDLSKAKFDVNLPKGATISPDPATIKVEDSKEVEFTVTAENGEVTKYKTTVFLNNWFTVIVCADSEINMRNNSSDKMKEYVKKMINIHNYPEYKYSNYNFVTPKTELVIMAGDMDQDRGGSLDDFDYVFKQVIDAGIPFITIYGNHDWEPDYWGDDSRGYTYDGVSSNDRTLNVCNTYISRSEKLGITNVEYFHSQYKQVSPFVFKFRNVRFYMGQNYWFQCPYGVDLWAGIGAGNADFYAPDDEIINPLTSKINSGWKNDAAVWVQHYPFNTADKWWLNQNGNGKSQDSNKGAWNTAEKKRNKLKELIRSTKNPAFFAGHNHSEAIYTHSHTNGNFKEYIAGYFPEGKVFMVLMREGIGVVEVKSIQL
ncbi:hypothetical protein M2138_000056 [Dysgonomonadaceae bacterium PH5-43]|nr:hypothetical protein [Dysgonomonadaceae bacterium PH5-43]